MTRALTITEGYHDTLGYYIAPTSHGNLDYGYAPDGAQTHVMTVTDQSGNNLIMSPTSVSGDTATFDWFDLRDLDRGILTLSVVGEDVDGNDVTATLDFSSPLTLPHVSDLTVSINENDRTLDYNTLLQYVVEGAPVTVVVSNAASGQSIEHTTITVSSDGGYDTRTSPFTTVSAANDHTATETGAIDISEFSDGDITVTIATVDEFDRSIERTTTKAYNRLGEVSANLATNVDTYTSRVFGTTEQVADGTMLSFDIKSTDDAETVTGTVLVSGNTFDVTVDTSSLVLINQQLHVTGTDKFGHSLETTVAGQLVMNSVTPSYREAIDKDTDVALNAKPDTSYGVIRVGNPVFIMENGEIPTVTNKRPNCAQEYAGVVSRVNSDGSLLLTKLSVREDIPNLPILDPGDHLYLDADGSLTANRISSGICIGTKLDGFRVLLHQQVNVINTGDYTELVTGVHVTLTARLNAIKATLDSSLTHVDNSVLNDDRVLYLSSIAATINSVVLNLDDTTALSSNNVSRIAALESAQVGSINVNVSYDNVDKAVMISGNTTEVDEGAIVTLVHAQGTFNVTVNSEGFFSSTRTLSSGEAIGLYTVVATVSDRYGKSITDTGTTTIVAVRPLPLNQSEIAANFELTDTTRKGRVYGRLRGEFSNHTVSVSVYAGNDTSDVVSAATTTATVSTSGVFTFDVGNINVNFGTYAALNALVTIREPSGTLVAAKANKTYINSDGDRYTSDGALGTSGDAFGSA